MKYAIFNTRGNDSAWNARSGEQVEVIRALPKSETNSLLVGPMYRVKFEDGTETDAFFDELQFIEDKQPPKSHFLISIDCGSAQSFDEAVNIARQYAEKNIGSVKITGHDQNGVVTETAVCLPDGGVFGGKIVNKSLSEEEPEAEKLLATLKADLLLAASGHCCKICLKRDKCIDTMYVTTCSVFQWDPLHGTTSSDLQAVE